MEIGNSLGENLVQRSHVKPFNTICVDDLATISVSHNVSSPPSHTVTESAAWVLPHSQHGQTTYRPGESAPWIPSLTKTTPRPGSAPWIPSHTQTTPHPGEPAPWVPSHIQTTPRPGSAS